jgi:hypothetical protein
VDATGTDLLDWDIDSLFDEPPDDAAGAEADTGDNASGGGILADLVRRMGFAMEASFYFFGGFAPGWNEAPWHWEENDEEFNHVLGGGMSADMRLDFQISETFRVRNTFGFAYPGLTLTVKEFFFDYTIKDRVFLRAGKFIPSWGRSPYYPFANLLSRVPVGNAGGDPYVVRLNLPVGIGGIELITLTRKGYMAGNTPTVEELSYGGKYNLALPWADIDLGCLYHDAMPLRGIVSVKTTLPWDIEAYTEGLVSVPHETWDDLKLSANLGLGRDFFDELFTLGGEIFYNGEDGVGWFRPETELREADVSPFIGGFNFAFSFVLRPPLPWNFRVFSQVLYGAKEDTAQFVPGISCEPLPHMKVSLAVPMALGSREGTYYRKNADTTNRPFAIVFLVSLQGSHRFDYYR